MADIVIIGAGLTGLSTAYHLEQQGMYDYELFERAETVGGLCSTVVKNGFTFDYTGHLLHSSSAYFNQFLDNTIGMKQLGLVNRQSWIYSHNVYTPYPYQQNLYGLPSEVIAECIEGYVNRSLRVERPESFYAWVLQEFGVGFGNHFFFPYQEKIFAYDIKRITASWTGRFVPQTTLRHIIDGALGVQVKESVGYNAQFWYPKQGGIGSWLHAIAQCIKKPVHTKYNVKSINTEEKLITFDNGHIEPYKKIISTMPLDQLMLLMQGNDAVHDLKNAGKKLLCNAVMNINLGINRSDLSDKHWIYFPEAVYPFYRIGFPHNFSSCMVPQGMSSLYAEYAFLPHGVNNHDELIRKSIQAIKALLHITSEQIVTESILHIPHAYVIYDQWREDWLPKIHEQLDRYAIVSVGRYGAWKYSSMQEAVLDGKAEAEKIMQEWSNTVPIYKEYTL